MSRIHLVFAPLALLLTLATPARAAQQVSIGEIYLGLADTLGTADYGHRLERRHGGGIMLGTRLVLPMEVGPLLVGGAFSADAAGGPFANSHDDWIGVYLNFRIDFGAVVGTRLGGAPLLFMLGGAWMNDSAMVDSLLGYTGWFVRARFQPGPMSFDAGFTLSPEKNLLQLLVGAKVPLSTFSGGGSFLLLELQNTFGLASQNSALHAKAALALGF